MLKNKKGISDIIVIVMIVLLAMGLMAVLFMVIQNIAGGGMDEIQMQRHCLDVGSKIRISGYDLDDEGNLTLTVRRGLGSVNFDSVEVHVEGEVKKIIERKDLEEGGKKESIIKGVVDGDRISLHGIIPSEPTNYRCETPADEVFA